MIASIPVDLLLSEDHPAAAVLVEEGRVIAANAAASSLLEPGVVAGVAVASLFDEGSRAKLAAALAADRRGAVELQSRGGACAPQVVCFVVEPLGARRLLVAHRVGPAYGARAEHTLLDLNARLANLTRELSQQGAELAAAKAELERVAALRDAAMAALSHDIRSPLAAIVLLAASLEKRAGSAPEDIARRAQSIQRNAERVIRLVDELLDVARIESGRDEIAAEPVLLAAVAADVLDSVEPIASAGGKRLELAAADTGPVSGDPTRLFQVFANLVTNAVRHSPSGGAVRVAIEEDGARVRCIVRDEGPGVPAELRDHLFERFRRGRIDGGSAGLGLYITRRLVELHGGRIWLEEPGPRGAGFVFELPRLPPSARDA